MARTEIKYIEQKTEGRTQLEDRGPAVIAEVRFSKTGRTIYYKNKTFMRLGGQGIYGNHRCVEDGNEYWISGVKKRGSNRHWAGGGDVVLEVSREQLEKALKD